jgi:hypothetical protein
VPDPDHYDEKHSVTQFNNTEAVVLSQLDALVNDPVFQSTFGPEASVDVNTAFIEFFRFKNYITPECRYNRAFFIKLFNLLNQAHFITSNEALTVKQFIAEQWNLDVHTIRHCSPESVTKILDEFATKRQASLHFFSRSHAPKKLKEEPDSEYFHRLHVYAESNPLSRTAAILKRMNQASPSSATRHLASSVAPSSYKEFYERFMRLYMHHQDSLEVKTLLSTIETQVSTDLKSEFVYRKRVEMILQHAERGNGFFSKSLSYRVLQQLSAAPRSDYFKTPLFTVYRCKDFFILFMKAYLTAYKVGWRSHLVAKIQAKEKELHANGYPLDSDHAYRERVAVILQHAKQGKGLFFNNRTYQIIEQISQRSGLVVFNTRMQDAKGLSPRLNIELDQRAAQFLPHSVEHGGTILSI